MSSFSSVVASIFLLSFGLQPSAEAFPTIEQTSPRVSNVALLFPVQTVRPGSEFEGVIEFFLDPGWHVYWKNPGDIGTAPVFDWELPPGITLKEISWPAPSRLKTGEAFFYGYEGNPKWVVRLAVDPSMPEGAYPIKLSAFWILCDGVCVPASQVFEASLTVSAAVPEISPSETVQKAKALLPIPASGGGVSTDGSTMALWIPLHQEKDVRSVVLFPEHSGLFAIEQVPQWEWKDGNLLLTVHSLADAPSILAKEKKFSGLCQIITPSHSTTYAITAPYEGQVFGQQESVTTAPSENILYIALLLAFAGGFFLNLTPCVLPVLGLKLLTLLSLRDSRLRQVLPHGLAYTAGVLIAFWTLAGILYFFESLGAMMGWGFQLQEPHFVMVLSILLLCLAENLFGLFEVGTSVAAWASEVEYQKGLSAKSPTLSAAVVSGVLATLIATPCTGPLLGSVLGFASTFNPMEGLLLFTAVGLGMSLPMLAATAFPPLIRLLPRPGPWMVSLKQFLGFCVLTTMAWLLWVLSKEVPSLSCIAVLSGFLLVAFGLWIFGRWGTPIQPKVTRFVSRFCALLIVGGGVLVLAASIDQRLVQWLHRTIPERPTIQWQPYSKAARDAEVHKGNMVFVSFDARWCLTCQTNKLSFLPKKVVKAFKSHHIVAMEADWTDGDPEITAELRALGRNGVPVYAIYQKGREPTLLPGLITPDIIVQAIEGCAKK